MKKRNLSLFLSAMLVACTNTGTQQLPPDQARIDIALELYHENNLALALQQWQILALRFPQDEAIVRNISQIQREIKRQKVALLAGLKKVKGDNLSKRRRIMLKILALTPDDSSVKALLREQSWQVELANANNKTEFIATVYKHNDSKAKNEIAITRSINSAEHSLHKKDYEAVIMAMKNVQSHAPEHTAIGPFLTSAYKGMGEQFIDANQYVKGLSYLELALEYASVEAAGHLQTNIANIKRKQSNKYLNSAQKILKNDIDKAIDLLQKSVAINPKNARAVQLLARAKKIQKNLLLIRNG